MNDVSRASIIKILVRRDNLTNSEAEELINECREALERGEENAIAEYLGLEDDYIFGIL